MADSKLAAKAGSDDLALMTRAMAYRVKYRVPGGILTIPIHFLGSHKMNRGGGVYCNGVRCKSLLKQILKCGFKKKTVNRGAIAVEEPPASAIPEMKNNYQSAAAYNIAKTLSDELLSTCFQEPYTVVRYTMLGHNHALMILRGFLTKARWNLEDIGREKIQVCDAEGRLSLSAVAEFSQGRELAEMVRDGIECEVLSWKMDIEEPDAAAIISQALNNPATLAMALSEISAISILKGEIMLQMKDLGQTVAFETVLNKVRLQLAAFADDPDLKEVFDWLISSGVGSNNYIDDFLDWAVVFIKSEKRRLRLSAWRIINKMPSQAMWSRMAVLKRSYRQPPQSGYCPSPEPFFALLSPRTILSLEELLRFFHTAVAGTDKIASQSRIQVLSQLDICAVDTFLGNSCLGARTPLRYVRVKELCGYFLLPEQWAAMKRIRTFFLQEGRQHNGPPKGRPYEYLVDVCYVVAIYVVLVRLPWVKAVLQSSPKR